MQRAGQRVQDLLADHHPERLPDDFRKNLVDIMSKDARRHGHELSDASGQAIAGGWDIRDASRKGTS